jgi:MFS family permease
LAAGYLTGAAGALVVVASAQVGSFGLLVAGMALFGAGNTASLLARYAAADLAEPARRGRALSTVLFATTFGAVAGPNLVEPAGALAGWCRCRSWPVRSCCRWPPTGSPQRW